MRSVKFITIAALLLLSQVPPKQADSEPRQPKKAPPSHERNFSSSDPAPDASNRNEPMNLRQNDLTWLVENSSLIFIGRLIDQSVEKDKRGLIITRNHFQIEKTLIGDSEDKKITLTLLGGTLGRQTLEVSHLPVLDKGRRYIIFTDPNRTTYNPITGNENGVFVVGPNDSGVYTHTGISVAGVEEGFIRLGGQVLQDYFEQDPKGPSLLTNPDVRGEITTVERAKTPVESAMPLDQFAEIILSLTETAS